MRVITGTARGRRLQTPDGYDVRPTTEKVKEAMFSSIQFDIEGRKVLDLFAGSGQLGIEALSRGAEQAVFTDSSQTSINIVKANLDTARLADRAKVLKTDFKSYLETTRDRFDIAFLDPPYSTGMLGEALALLPRVMNEYAIILCEHPVLEDMPQQFENFNLHKTYKYSKIAFTVYRREGADL